MIKDWITIGISALTFLTTIIIAFLVHRYTKRTTTISALEKRKNNIREIDHNLSNKFPDKELDLDKLEEQNSIDNNRSTWEIISLLNEYEALASGVNEKIYEGKIVKISRKEAMLSTFTKFESFIYNWRKDPNNSNAWEQLVKCVEKWKKN